MVRNKFSLLVYAIIGLAVIGVITQLFTNTASFLTSILTMVGFAAAIFAVIYFLSFGRGVLLPMTQKNINRPSNNPSRNIAKSKQNQLITTPNHSHPQ